MYEDDTDPLTERLYALIREHGEPEHVSNLESGFMAHEEKLQVARDILFAPAGAWPRYQPRRQRHVLGKLMAEGLCGEHDTISWETVPTTGELSSEERMRVDQLRGLLPEATVEVVDHVALAGRGQLVFRGAQVVLEIVEGNTVMREFRLDTDPETERLFERLSGVRGSTPPSAGQARTLLRQRGHACEDSDEVEYEVLDADTLSTEEHRRMRRIQELAPLNAEVKPVWFVVSCRDGQLRRTAAKVSCPVYTGIVSRTYRLDVEPTP